jgi:hypothetical protein
LRRQYPKTVATLLVLLLGLAAGNVWLATRLVRYRAETERLRSGMSEAERRRADLVLASEEHRVRVTLELVRRQARGDQDLHLAVSVDSGRMYLERAGVVLREMAVQLGPSRPVGAPPDTVRLALPRGTRTVVKVQAARDPWDVPVWVFGDRGVPVPDDRAVPGALGANGILLNGGTVIYSIPPTGPLADSTYALPGSVLATAEDLRAIAPNVAVGMKVYFY